MIEQNQEVAQPVVQPSMADYKKARSEGKDVTVAAPAAETPTTSEVVSPAPAPQGEPAATGTAKEPIQDGQQHPKRDKTAAGRARELIAEGRLEEAQSILDGAAKKDRERAEKAEQELRELRGRTPEPAKPAEVAKPQETKQEANARKVFLAEYFKNNPDAVYEDGLDAFDEVNRESDRKALFEEWDKRSEEKRQREAAEAAQQSRMAKAKEKYSDYDDVIAAGRAATADVPANAGVSAAFNESEIVGELAYHFSANPEEFRRISALPPKAAYRAVVALELQLSTPGSTAPVTPERPIIPPSASPAPPAAAGGGFSGSSAKTADKARDFSEYKKLRQG